MKRLFLVAVLGLVAVLSPLSLLAQRVTVRGHIVGEDGKPLAGADVLLVNKDNGQKFTMRTDKNGDYVNVGVALGIYHLTVTKDGRPLYKDDIATDQEEKIVDINIPKAQVHSKEEALKQLTPEQRKQIE